ncbi:unnamed protein product, partial [Rotaria magnacalcarata]
SLPKLSLALFSLISVFGYRAKNDKDLYDNLLFVMCIGDIIIGIFTINIYGAVYILLCLIAVFILICYAVMWLCDQLPKRDKSTPT